MISKELLSEVLGWKDVHIVHTKLDMVVADTEENFSDPDWDEDWEYGINIYELAHLCKIWAAKENFKVDDELSYGIERGRVRLIQYQEYDMYDVFGYKIGRDSKSDWFEEDSVPEAIFKACEWILEQKDINKEV